MARPTPTERLEAIERIVRANPGGMSAPEIARALSEAPSDRTIQSHLKRLVRDGRLVRESSGRWARNRAPETSGPATAPVSEAAIPLSGQGADIQQLVRRPEAARHIARELLEGYRPNESFYLRAADRTQLADIARRSAGSAQPADTYARHILGRLLIDLAWNSSRLEGNTYSLLDARRLIEFGQQAAEERDQSEAQMILSHKDAVEFLVENATEIAFNRHTILDLHGVLANNLLADRGAAVGDCAVSASA